VSGHADGHQAYETCVQHSPDQVGGQHDAAPVPAIHEDSCDRRDHKHSEGFCDHQSGDRRRRVPVATQQRRSDPQHHGRQRELVANAGYGLPEPQPCEVRVDDHDGTRQQPRRGRLQPSKTATVA
jgi:hypothetical protein